MVTTAYSYIRFSSLAQQQGDSLRRQSEKAVNYSSKRGWQLDQTLMIDKGKTAFRGKKQGELEAFLQAIEAGKVAKGSALIVESVDRISRKGIDEGYDICKQILKAGVHIVTLSPEREFTPETVKGLTKGSLELLVILERAREESETKSVRVRAARDQARKRSREGKGILTRRCPSWLTFDGEKFQPVPGAKEMIEKIFDWRLSGLGVHTIQKKLNSKLNGNKPNPEITWIPRRRKGQKTNGWHLWYLKYLTKCKALIGYFQPHEQHYDEEGNKLTQKCGDEIANYYPIMISPEKFHAVSEIRKRNQKKGGKNGKSYNLLVHIVHCAYCGKPMSFAAPVPWKNWYLYCDTARRGLPGCAFHSIHYGEVEKLVLENCPKLNPEQVLPNPGENAQRSKTIRDRLSGFDGELATIELKINNYTDQLGECSKSMRERFQAKIKELESRQAEIEKLIEQDKRSLQEAENGFESFTAWKQNLETLRKQLGQEGDVDIRLRARKHLRDLIEKVEIFADGYLPDDDDPVIEGLRNNEADTAFIRYVRTRRHSKEGRFIRVTFKSGSRVDLVPLGSIASGFRLIGKVWKFVDPDIDQLEKEFENEQPKKKRKKQLQTA